MSTSSKRTGLADLMAKRTGEPSSLTPKDAPKASLSSLLLGLQQKTEKEWVGNFASYKGELPGEKFTAKFTRASTVGKYNNYRIEGEGFTALAGFLTKHSPDDGEYKCELRPASFPGKVDIIVR